jgi:signal transduction histidine kinase/ActR/RegA family two-component response regulator
MRDIPTGNRDHAESREQPLADETEGRISTVQYRAVVVDLEAGTAIEAALASEERLRLLSDNLPDSALYQITRDPDGRLRLIYVSAGIEPLTGILPADALRDADLVLRQFLPEHRSRIAAAAEKSAHDLSDFDLEAPIRRVDGEVRWMRIKSRPRRSPDGSVTWDGIQSDVTETRRIKAELHLTSERFEAALRGASVEIANRQRTEEALKEANQRKDEFLAMLAHELRNPLAPIRNAALLLRRGPSGDPGLEDAHDTLERQLDHLVRLVDDLVDVSRVSRGTITLKAAPLDLADVVRHAVSTSRALASARRQTLTVSLPPEPVHVEGDATRLSQVAHNLLSNAVKYTDPGGRIHVTLERAGAVAAPEAVLRVRDSGVGLDAAALGSVFDVFFQAGRDLDRSQGGMGVGLSLVKSLVELHGGSVEAHSRGPGHGSEFVVRLPSLPEAPPPSRPQPPTAPREAARSLRILVVDDNVDAAETLAMLLELEGHEAQIAYDGREAVDVALAERPDVVLLDIGLPRMNGYEACKAMRAGGLTNTLIVATTGYGQEEDRRRSREAGFDSHQVKPVLLSTIQLLLSQQVAAGRIA